MMQKGNPFIRGYQNLQVERQVVITYADDCAPCYLPLHPSQAHLPDDQIKRFPCAFTKETALITEGQEIPAELDVLHDQSGIVRSIVYDVHTQIDDNREHVADTPTLEAAQAFIRRNSFETGFFSRCWEISTAHISDAACQWLTELADNGIVSGLMFEAFRMPVSPAVGIKLIGTPWTDAHLQQLGETSAEALRREQAAQGAPEWLLDVIHLAAQADTRILIFDADAAVLEGLPVLEQDWHADLLAVHTPYPLCKEER